MCEGELRRGDFEELQRVREGFGGDFGGAIQGENGANYEYQH